MIRRKAPYLAGSRTFSYDHASANANVTVKLWTVPAGRLFRVTRVFYNNPTGLAANGSNYFTINVLNAALSAAARSTASVPLTADTPVELTLNVAESNRVLPAGTVLALNLALTGTATLPAGRVVIEGDLL